MDEVRQREYSRLSGKDRRFIKGQRYNLLSRRENLTTEGREALRLLFRANKRLHTAYLLRSRSASSGTTTDPAGRGGSSSPGKMP